VESIINGITEYLGEIVLAAVTGVIAYFSGRKKERVELKQAEGTALTNMQAAYDKFTADSLKRYEDLAIEVRGLKDLTKHLQEELDDCRKITNKNERNK
jgi:hypothetical protein